MLRNVALMNLRIVEQGPVRVLLRGVPPTWKGVAWNGGYLSGIEAVMENSGD